jgi:ribosomal-protein-alanine N-acetyltransferase
MGGGDRERPPGDGGGEGLRFRRMRLGDLDRVMEIERDSFASPWSRDLIRRELDHDWSTILLAIEPRGAPAGEADAIVGLVVYWLIHDELHVLNVAVGAGERRRGVGRALMREAERRGRAARATVATLEVRRSNAAAIELYRALGYRQAGVRPRYYADEGEDAIVMVLEL